MVQLAVEAPGQPVGHTSYVPKNAYVYDVEHRGGVASPSLRIMDLEALTPPVKSMGSGVACPVATGACVTSVAGGDVTGYDMYGQYIMETVAAAGTSTIAFASVVDAPDDVAWVNQYGLPYAYKDDSVQPAPADDITIIPPAEDGDARGTFTYSGEFGEFGSATVFVPYQVQRAHLYGMPYADRYASEPFDTSTLEVTGTIDNTGAVSIVIPSTGGVEVPCEIRLPGVGHVVGVSGTTVNAQLPELWMQQYGRQISDGDAILDKLITVDPLGNEYAPVYVNLTGSVSNDPVDPPEEPPAPAAPPTTPWATHGAAEAWLDQFTTATGIGTPLDWSDGTLADKHAAAVSLYDQWEN